MHPCNIRGDLGDLSGLADSIAAQGQLEALTVIPHVTADGTPGHQIVAGHRRAAAAILAGLTSVPCVLRPDLAIDENGSQKTGDANRGTPELIAIRTCSSRDSDLISAENHREQPTT